MNEKCSSALVYITQELENSEWHRTENNRLLLLVAEKDAELAEAKKDLALNASMLARQTDLARAAETAEKHLRNALENIRYNTRDNNAFMIAEDALKEQP